jgi:hypothetical protein
MFLDQIKVADLDVRAGLLQLCPDFVFLLCGLCAGRAFLIFKTPAKRDTGHSGQAIQFLAARHKNSNRISQEYRQNLEEFRSDLEEI